MRSGATPGIATTMTISRSSSKTSAGGSQDVCVLAELASRKNCRCSRSACSTRPNACHSIQSDGSVPRDMRPDPLQQLGGAQRAGLSRDLPAIAESDQRGDAADAEARRDLRLGLGVELGEMDSC